MVGRNKNVQDTWRFDRGQVHLCSYVTLTWQSSSILLEYVWIWYICCCNHQPPSSPFLIDPLSPHEIMMAIYCVGKHSLISFSTTCFILPAVLYFITQCVASLFLLFEVWPLMKFRIFYRLKYNLLTDFKYTSLSRMWSIPVVSYLSSFLVTPFILKDRIYFRMWTCF